MKWLVGLLLLGIVIFMTLGIIANKKYDTARKARQTEEAQKPEAMTENVSVAEPVQDVTASLPAEAAGSDSTAEIQPESNVQTQSEDEEATGLGRPEATRIIGSGKAGPILEVARLFDITLTGIKTDVGGAIIKVTWKGDDEKAGQKFLDELKKQKLIDSSDEDQSKEDYRFDKGEKVWTASYRVIY